MPSDTYIPKLSIEITLEQQSALRSIDLPHGWQRAIFSSLVDDIIELNSLHGPMALALIITGKIKPSEALATLIGAKSYGKEFFKGDKH